MPLRLHAGVLIDASHSSAVDFDIAVIDFAMNEGFQVVYDAMGVFDLLQVEVDDSWQILSEIANEAIDWMNETLVLPENHVIAFSEHESNVLLVVHLDDL